MLDDWRWTQTLSKILKPGTHKDAVQRGWGRWCAFSVPGSHFRIYDATTSELRIRHSWYWAPFLALYLPFEPAYLTSFRRKAGKLLRYSG